MAQGRWVSRLRSTRTGRWIRLNARLESALLTNCLGPCAKLIRRGAKRARSPRHMEAGDGPDSDGGTDAGRSHAGFRRTRLCRLAVAVVAFIAWGIWGPEPRLAHGLVAAVAVLIIACPCALGLATPCRSWSASGAA